MAKSIITGILVLVLSDCGAPGYNPNNARNLQDQLRNSNPHLNCPSGSVTLCDVQGGALAGKKYSNCRCVR